MRQAQVRQLPIPEGRAIGGVPAGRQAVDPLEALVAQLLYGGGLRLMEVLRLRIKDVDLEQRCITVRCGKGDKDRRTVLPSSLVDPAWQSILVDKCQEINVALSSDVQTANLFFAGLELGTRSIKYDRDLTVLHRLGLLFQFKYDNFVGEGKTLPYVQVSPTTFGVMLFAIAHNKLDSWRSYPQESYESAADIKPLSYSTETLEALCSFTGILYVAE